MDKDHPIVLFDGVCNFCNGIINFLISQDKKNVLRFAAMQSEAGKKILTQYGFEPGYTKSFVFIINGKAYKKSTAALKLYNQLPWYWKWIQIFWIVPTFIRDGVYEYISENRYKWFGKKSQCMLPSPGIKSRFLE